MSKSFGSEVFCPKFTRLGDSVIAVSNAINYSFRLNRQIKFSPNPKIWSWAERYQRRALENFYFALSLFNWSRNLTICSKSTRAINVPSTPKSNYICHTTQTNSPTTNLILYDFNPKTPYNRPTDSERQLILAHLETLGQPFDLHTFANRHGLFATCPLFLSSLAFVGCDSGFAHVAHCFNIPTFLFRFRGPPNRLERWHNHQPYTLCHPNDLSPLNPSALKSSAD